MFRYLFLFLLCISFYGSVYAQNEVPAQFPGGEEALKQYMLTHLQYPEKAMKQNIEGVVKVRFVVDTTGAVTNAAIEQSLGYGCDEEALRVINNMPAWTPASVKGKKVRMTWRQSVRFKLEEPTKKKKGK